MTHEPDLPPDEVTWIRDWHDRAYAEGHSDATRTFTYLDHTIVVPPHVQPVVGMAHVLGSPVLAEVQASDRVLDMGTGSGVNAILAASVSTSVVAVDVNPYAVAAARHNAELNGVADRVETRLSDVFSAVPERFDLILFDPPFRWFAPRDWFERATTDADYRTLTTFMREARHHLEPTGRMLVSFGTTGDLGFLHRLSDVLDRDGLGWEFTGRDRGTEAWAVFRADGGPFPVFSSARGDGLLPPRHDLQEMTEEAVADLLAAAGHPDQVGWIRRNITAALLMASLEIVSWEGEEWALVSDDHGEPTAWAG